MGAKIETLGAWEARGEADGSAWKETTELVPWGGGKRIQKWGEDRDEKEEV